jgi:biofilm PGA synthesis lipoprotein PgaB
MRLLHYFSLILCTILLLLQTAHAANHAVILLYHHVGNDTPDSTSVSTQQFTQHIRYLKQNSMHVTSLTALLKSLKAGEELPKNTVVITFDDAYKSLQQHALPLLKKEGLPFALFVNPGAIDKKYGGYMNWQDLREIMAYGGEILNHGTSHTHMVRRLASESKQQWQTRIIHEIEYAQNRIEQEVGTSERIFSYPYGEFNFALQDIITKLGYTAVGQQSGAVDTYSNPTALPRYPIMGRYAENEPFTLRLNSMPLPVSPSQSVDHLLAPSNLQPKLHLKLHLKQAQRGYDQKRMQCYFRETPLTIQWQNTAHTSFEITSSIPLSPGRNKYTCTAPSLTSQGVYYWYSHPWILPNEDGSWPKEQ